MRQSAEGTTYLFSPRSLEKYQGRGEKRQVTVGTKKARQWGERPSSIPLDRSRGMQTLIVEVLTKIKPADPLKLIFILTDKVRVTGGGR